MSRPLVEILYFEGCPNYAQTPALVERIGAELGIEPQITLVDDPDPETAERLRFLGSPIVRVYSADVEPHATRDTTTSTPAASTAPTPASPASRKRAGSATR